MSIIYCDVETTGLEWTKHQIWEIAWAVDDGPIEQRYVPHSLAEADVAALKVGRYLDRWPDSNVPEWRGAEFSLAAKGHTLCAANPAFDTSFLRKTIYPSWKYRLLDIEAYAMGALGYDEPQGLRTIAQELRERGFNVPEPDHTAAGDVACLRECHRALRAGYASPFWLACNAAFPLTRREGDQ